MTAHPSPDVRPEVVRELSRKIDEVVARWRTRLHDEIMPPVNAERRMYEGNVETGVASLRIQLANVERELSLVEQSITHELAITAAHERRAMDAIAKGDDHAAKTALVAQSAHTDTSSALEADRVLLRALADECRRAIAAAEPVKRATP